MAIGFCLINISFAQTTDDFLNVNPQNKDELLAAQYFQNKEFDKALELYSKLFNKNQNDYYYNPYLSCLIELKKFDNAEKLIKKLIKQNSEILKYKVDLGYIYKLEGDQKKSEKQFESAINSLTKSEQQVLDLGNAFESKSEFNFAIETYKRGRKLLKGQYSFFLELANVYSKLNDLNSMFEEYVDAIEENPIYSDQVENILHSIVVNDVDNKKIEILKTVLITKSQRNPDKIIFSEMLIWLDIQDRNFESAINQAKAIDKRFKEDGHRIIDIAKIVTDNDEYDLAIKSYQYLISKGKDNPYFITAKINLINVIMQKITNKRKYTNEELKELEKQYLSTIEELGKNSNTVFLLKDYAHLEAFYFSNYESAINILQEAINLSSNSQQAKAQCKLELADVYLLVGEVWDASLLYSQVEKSFKNEPIGHAAKFKNAKLSYYRGDFKWAQAQLDVLKAATSKLIANDALELSLLITDNIDDDSVSTPLMLYAKANLLAFQNKFELAQKTLDSISEYFKSHQIISAVLYKKAQLYFYTENYKEAANLFKQIVDNYGSSTLGDNALFELAELNEKTFKDKEKAKELYQELILKYPGSIYIVEARKRFRSLRGDLLN